MRHDALMIAIAEAMGLNVALIRRIVIDIDIQDYPRVYVQYVSSEQLLQVDWPGHLKAAKVEFSDQPAKLGDNTTLDEGFKLG